MIAVIGGACAAIKIKMKPQPDAETMQMMGGMDQDVYDYNNANVAAKEAGGDDITMTNSGCGYNIAVNLVKKGLDVSFATVLGNDAYGYAVMHMLKEAGVDTGNVKTADGSTPVRVDMLNILGDPMMSQYNDKIYNEITVPVVKTWANMMEDAEAIVIDGNLPAETIEYIAETYGDKKKIFFDPANHIGSIKARDVVGKFHCVMPGRLEAEALAKKTILSEDELMAAGRHFEEQGVSKTVITMKGGGLYYKDGMNEGILRPENVLMFAATSGAGDVVSAAVVAADLQGKTMDAAAAEAMADAAEFLKDRDDTRPIDAIQEEINER